MTDLRVVFMTAPDADTAARIVRTLVEEKHIACGNILPGVQSIFAWEGTVHVESEVLCILKTRPDMFDALRRRIVEAVHQ